MASSVHLTPYIYIWWEIQCFMNYQFIYPHYFSSSLCCIAANLPEKVREAPMTATPTAIPDYRFWRFRTCQHHTGSPPACDIVQAPINGLPLVSIFLPQLGETGFPSAYARFSMRRLSPPSTDKVLRHLWGCLTCNSHAPIFTFYLDVSKVPWRVIFTIVFTPFSCVTF